MKSFFLSLCRNILPAIIVFGLLTGITVSRAQNSAATNDTTVAAPDPAADKAWAKVSDASQPPPPPAAWSDKEPTQEEINKFYRPELTRGADLARDFYTRYPKSPQAEEAKAIEYKMLSTVVLRFGETGTNYTARLDALDAQQLSDPKLSEDDRLRIRFQKLQNLMGGMPGTQEKMQAAALAVLKDFPKREEVYSVLLMTLSHSEGDPAKKFAEQILASSVPDEVKTQVKILERVGDMRKLISGLPGTQDELEKSVDALAKDYPGRQEIYQLKLILLREGDPKHAPAIGQEILASSAPDEIKQQAKSELDRLSALGKPVDIQYQSVDGRAVDLAKMKGKVVLVDFWATWCGPCMAELPNVKAAYAKLHDQGFEIVGISFDESKDALDKTLKEKGMTWPQFFDGNGWKNKYAQQFHIEAIPAMWLIDKKGNLRDIDARTGLADKVTKLLAEQ